MQAFLRIVFVAIVRCIAWGRHQLAKGFHSRGRPSYKGNPGVLSPCESRRMSVSQTAPRLNGRKEGRKFHYSAMLPMSKSLNEASPACSRWASCRRDADVSSDPRIKSHGCGWGGVRRVCMMPVNQPSSRLGEVFFREHWTSLGQDSEFGNC